MIPFELIEYPKTCTCHLEEPSEEFPSGVTNVPLSCLMHGARVTIFAKRKRLTTPELAAEYWRHNETFTMLAEGYRPDSFGTESQETGREAELIEQARLKTIMRFALLPHYDEKETP